MNEPLFCHKCGTTTEHELSRCIISSGTEFFGWYCWNCNSRTKKNGSDWVKKEWVRNKITDLSAIPTAQINPRFTCARCEKEGAELHHWAPRAMFPDAERWPMSHLCKSCHDQWHRIVTPSLIYK